MIQVAPGISIAEEELEFAFVRASGPGGQKVNKVSSAVQLRFDVAGSRSLPAEVKGRLVRLAGSRMSGGGVLVIEAHRYRTQKANRDDAVERLAALLRRAARVPKKRLRTAPTAAARRRRLDAKRRRGLVKRLRTDRPQAQA